MLSQAPLTPGRVMVSRPRTLARAERREVQEVVGLRYGSCSQAGISTRFVSCDLRGLEFQEACLVIIIFFFFFLVSSQSFLTCFVGIKHALGPVACSMKMTGFGQGYGYGYKNESDD